jgi:hypothetical protein
MPSDYHIIKAKIQNAIKHLRQQKKPNITKTTRDFEVPISHLRVCWKGRQTQSQRTPLNQKLDNTQELALKTYINTLDEMIIPPQPKQIVKLVNEILYADHTNPMTPPPKVNIRWLK